jgi:hypothetical protein
VRIEFPSGIEVIEVQERVENEEVAADRCAPPHGIVGKKNDVPLSQRNIHDDGPLRDIVAVEKPRREKIALIAQTQNDPIKFLGGYRKVPCKPNLATRIYASILSHLCRSWLN